MTDLAVAEVNRAPPDPAHAGRTQLLVAVTAVSVDVLALAVGCSALTGINAASAGPYGLVQAYPVAAWACLAAVVLTFGAVLWWSPDTSGALVVSTIAMITLLHGAGPLSEHAAALSVTWLHAGFVQHIDQFGTILRHTDARWSWPGFFAAAASLTRAAGLRSPQPLLLFAPLAFELSYLPPVILLARSLLRKNVRARWLAIWLFFDTNWTGQDYFSPQAVAELLFLCALALTVTFLLRRPNEHPRPVRRRVRRLVDSPDEDPWLAPSPAYTFRILVVVFVIGVGLTVTHQLTPVAFVAGLTALAASARLKTPVLPLLLAFTVVAYVCYAASDYWLGHLNAILGIGDGGTSALAQNTTGKLVGDPAHVRVVYVRLLLTGALWTMAVAGFKRHWRPGRRGWTVALLALAPLPIPLVQPYGGEALIRAFLYSLPFAAALAAFAFYPDTGRRLRRHIAMMMSLLALPGLFLIARYGNASFETMRAGEVTAMAYVYRVAPPGTVLIAGNSNLPWEYEGLGTYRYGYLADPLSPSASARSIVQAKIPAYVILTSSQEAFEKQMRGVAASNWRQVMTRGLLRAPGFSVAFQDSSATVVRYQPGAP